MNRISARMSGLVAAAAFGTLQSMAYINDSPFSTDLPPNIDDVVFVNQNIFQVFTEVPFETQNTLYFTNSGTLNGRANSSFAPNGGVRLEYIDGDTGYRRPANTINNLAGASISGQPTVILNATNIFNQGTISASQSGVVRITGDNVDLHRGVINLGRSSPSAGFATSTNYVPASGVTDVYWGLGTNTATVSTLLSLQGTKISVRSPQHRVVTQGGFGFVTQLQLNGPRSWVYQQFVGDAADPTNQVIQAVFVLNGATNINTDVTFVPGPDPNNSFRTVSVQFSGYETNIVTGQPVLKQLFLTDTLASDTNFFLITNALTLSTYRPASYDLEWTGNGGAASNAVITTNMFKAFFSPTFTNGSAYSNTIVGANYTAYRATVNGRLAPPVNSAFTPITNYGGRLEVVADTLDLSKARLQSQSLISVSAKNYRGSKGVAVDAPFVNYDLATRDTILKVQTLTGSSLNRFASGDITAFSTVFTNFFDLQVTNTDTGNIDTKHYETAFHIVMVSSSLVNLPSPVEVTTLNLGHTNVTIEDPITVSTGVTTAAENLTVNSALSIGSSLFRFGSSNAPSLKNLTNNGIFDIFGSMNLGVDRGVALDSYVNRGTNSVYGAQIWTKDFQNYGQIQSTYGAVSITADALKFDGSANSISSGTDIRNGGDIILSGKSIKFRSSTITSSRAIALRSTDSLIDAGIEFPNHFITSLGFGIESMPAAANLLATTIEVNAPGNTEAVVTWPSKNLGAKAAGYANNGAIGKLVLSSGANGQITLVGSAAGQAVYVDYLQIDSTIAQSIADYINPVGDYTLYFADSNLPAEQLDGLLDGRLRWVNSYAGSYSGVDLATPSGVISRVNRALLNSQVIDSNGNGIANAYDADPFTITPVRVTLSSGANAAAKVSWPAVAGGRYRLESSSRLDLPDWKTVTTVTNDSTKAATLSGTESLGADGSTRFYRVTFEP